MFDLRPVGYVIGLLLVALGMTMLGPMIADLSAGNGEWPVFLESALLTGLVGGLVALACSNGVTGGLSIRQGFLLTTGSWVVVPFFGAIPFMLGEDPLPLVDAYFEAVSGVTTTGTTVISLLETRPEGLLLWRGILQWLGGLGIVIVALLFLPVMRVGGMQFFQAEGFDTMGKVLPRAADISWGLLRIYLGITAITFLGFWGAGMVPFEAIIHAFTAVSTGGFSTSDASFSPYAGMAQYICVFAMIVASLPFIRLLQFVQGEPAPLFRDSQVRAYLLWIAIAAFMIVAYRAVQAGDLSEAMVRQTLFTTVSIFSGTGYTDGDVMLWGPFAFVVLFAVGAIGGCTSSTGCSIKVFRYQVLFKAISAQIRRLHSSSRVVALRLDGRPLDASVVDSVILLVAVYVLSFGLLTVALSFTGLSFMASLTGAWTAIFNIGPAFGPEVLGNGSVETFPAAAKVLMTAGMLAGRLEIIAFIVLILPRFWRS